MRIWWAFLWLINAVPFALAAQTSCVQCHGDVEWIADEAWARMVKNFESDVHHSVGLSCHDCHGGNPDPKVAQDPFAAMDKAYTANPYRGVPARDRMPDFCGRCHSDAEYMKRFKPDARVDQVKEYWTSRHGKLLKAGDTNVATCVDCHGTHTIRRPSDAQSRVYPTAVAETCRTCHSDPKRMAGYQSKTGGPLPIDQYERWRRSVHAKAMFERDDLAAPTCNDCHGNHGAAPPELASITFVCGQCHGREASLFRKSPKHSGFQEHNQDLLPDMGPNRCAECHETPEPSAAITNLLEFTECITCHGNHAVVASTVTMLSPLPDTPCAYCHEGAEPVAASVAEPERMQENFRQTKQSLLDQAEADGVKGEDRFNWLVDQALNLPEHQRASSEHLGSAALRHEFKRLFTKFRIGKTYFTYPDPVTGEPVRERLVRCSDCHSPDSDGMEVSGQIAGAMHALAVGTARAERALLAAQRGGVEVRKAHLELDKAVDAQIQLQVLVHAFATQTNSDFARKRAEGLDVAHTALLAGHSALDELSYRRRGLLVSLGIILCVLVALALKIRQMSHRSYKP